MSEKAPKPINEADERLANFDANKEAHATQQYWDELLTVNTFDEALIDNEFVVDADGSARERNVVTGGDRIEATGVAGKDVFTDEARQQLEEASAYDKHLEAMAARSAESEDEYYDRHAEEGAEDSFDRTLRSSPELRRADMMARDIAERRANGGDEEYIRQKEDELESILNYYSTQPGADEGIVMRIMDATVTSAPSETAPSSSSPDKTTGAPKSTSVDAETIRQNMAENWAKPVEATATAESTPVGERTPSQADAEAAAAAVEAADGVLHGPERPPAPEVDGDTVEAGKDKQTPRERRVGKFRSFFKKMLKGMVYSPEEQEANARKEKEARQARAQAKAERKANKPTGFFGTYKDAYKNTIAEEEAKAEKAPSDADKTAAAAAVEAAEAATKPSPESPEENASASTTESASTDK